MPARTAGIAFALVMLVCCGGRKPPLVQDLEGREGFSMFSLISLRGGRDGDRLTAQAVFSDTSSMLTVEMRFAVGSPTKLVNGAWRWPRGQQMSGAVQERSVTFLGGQDGPPSLGGTFDLLDAAGKARYRINLPVQELSRTPVSPSR